MDPCRWQESRRGCKENQPLFEMYECIKINGIIYQRKFIEIASIGPCDIVSTLLDKVADNHVHELADSQPQP